ncbi:phenoloxidase 1-like [Eriocheir sinensis]|uniref:phenoloxidase 1-like n=1 Tax=Eriocheir sinensis TaxID=95602 RepID=UPI0021C584FA|nr:phenoloxidase 1-like [Eriocheir sinensis]
MASDQKVALDLFQRPYESRPIDEATPMGGGPPPPGPLTLARSIPRGSVFSSFLESHRLAAKELCDYLMQASNVRELSLMAEGVREVLNEKLFIYAVSSVILTQPEMRALQIPSIVEVFPSSFVPRTTLAAMEQQARQPSTAFESNATAQDAIITEYGPEWSSTHLKPEHRVAYWREDYGINAHHWHWHLVYPTGMNMERDRKGELFYYMHQQMLARYDMDRLSVGLSRVEKLANWRIPIPDGYFSKLTLDNSGQMWGSRQDNTLVQKFRRDGLMLDVTDLERQHSRLMDAIHQGHLIDREGKLVKLTDEGVAPKRRGIVLLGDAIEADRKLGLNSPFYGSLHNQGHIIISAAHDPDNAHKENLGVMSDSSTAMRDPVFYRWHKYIDDLFQEYKLTQPPYTMEQLSVQTVTVTGVEVESADRKNMLTTGWNTQDFEASRGLDFNSSRPVMVRLTHLDHWPFRYNIKVENEEKVAKEVTIRIFMAPKLNERGVDMNFMEQRLLWAEMDRFKQTLKPGTNTVRRESSDSSITNPKDFTFGDLLNRPLSDNPGAPDDNLLNICGCGWPQHMLLPRGKQEGMDFQLLVMVTDWKLDEVAQPAGRRSCANAASFCGVLDALYPDARPMGFPFDRRPMPMLNGQSLDRAEDLTRLSNVAMQEIQIVFTNALLTQQEHLFTV